MTPSRFGTLMYDISDLYLEHAERDRQLSELRHDCPVLYDERNDLWLVTRHADVLEVSRAPGTYSSAQGISYFEALPLALVTMDDPEHGRLRRIVSKQFTAKMVTHLEEGTRAYTEEAISRIASEGRADFVSAIAAPVTLKIIADMLGVPHDELPDVRRWIDHMMDAGGRLDEPGVAESAATNFTAWTDFVSQHIERRVSEDGTDLLSRLAHADEERLDMTELAMFATVLMVAGNETTRHTSSRGLEVLSQHPGQRRRLQDDPGLGPVATEEILRWTSVARGMMRTTLVDTTLSDVDIPAGARVELIYPSANRDEDVFDAPFEFRIDRDPNPQLAFGIGTHFCLGANLARMEVRVILQTVLELLPDIDLVPGTTPTHRANGLVAGVAEMPVVFTPRS